MYYCINGHHHGSALSLNQSDNLHRTNTKTSKRSLDQVSMIKTWAFALIDITKSKVKSMMMSNKEQKLLFVILYNGAPLL